MREPAIKRFHIYFKERFPLTLNIPFVALTYLGLSVSVQALYKREFILVDHTTLIGGFTALAMLLLLRISDELRDAEIDKILSPERPIPRGLVSLSEIRWLGMTTLVLLLAGNLFLSWKFTVLILLGLLALLGYNLLFFGKKRKNKNVVYEFLNILPDILPMNIYIIATVLFAIQAHYVDLRLLVPYTIFFLPILAWLPSRYIKGQGGESEYESYSKLLGPRKAALIPLASLITMLCLFALLASWLGFSDWFFGIIFILLSLVVFYYGRFIIFPSEDNNVLLKVTLVTSLSILCAFLLESVLIYNWHFKI